ncbi:MAG: hypothetical protein Alpg2KO_31570 [Alphaproteobacteria bacterium]
MSVEDAGDLASFFDPDEFALSAVYSAGGGGAGVSVPVLARRGEALIHLDKFNRGALSGEMSLMIRTSDCPDLARGDTFTIDGELLECKSPELDATRKLWSVQVAIR